MKTAAALLTCLLFSACSADVVVDANASSWGAPLVESEAVALDALLADPASWDGKEITVSGPITSVCQSKGCWMVMTAGDQTMRVTFLDYGFYVPMDLTGDVTVGGVFSVKTLSEGDARHYLEDEGKHDEAAKIVGPQKEFSLVAVGVERGE